VQSTILVGLLAALTLTGCASTPPPTSNLQSPNAFRASDVLTLLGFPLANVHIIESDSLAAYSYSDGSIYLTRALIDRTTNNQLAAVIAHELGHLAAAPTSPARFALEGSTHILLSHNIPPTSLSQSLTLVRDDPQTPPNLKPALTQRISRLP
jgi:hypothetical protein